jgi:hypothetical protein
MNWRGVNMRGLIAYGQAFLVALLSMAACAALIAWVAGSHAGSRMAYDEANYHLPTIVHFLQGGTVSDYPSATTPGYHLLMAGVARLTGVESAWLRYIGAAITALLVYLIAERWEQASVPSGAWFALPLIGSVYLIPAGAWLLPDNLAWLLVMGALCFVMRDSWSDSDVISLSAICVGTVFVRQSNAWVLGPVLLSAWVGPGAAWRCSRRLLALTVLALPALLLLTFYASTWHGLVPPGFQSIHQKLNPIAPAWFLFQFGVVAIFYLPCYDMDLIQTLRATTVQREMALGVLIGLFLASIVPSSFSPDDGRVSGYWELVRVAPTFAGRSPLVILGAAWGGMLLALLLSQVAGTKRMILLLALAGFCSANVFNQYAFDRYYQVFVYMLLSLMAVSRSDGRLSGLRAPTMAMLSLGALFAINASVMVLKVR